jgi:hypothetical protein
VKVDGPVHKKNFSISDLGLTLPHWTSSFNYQNGSYSFTVIGSDPALGKETVIPTVIVPYRLIFADGHILDASTDVIDGVTPLNGALNSPIFKSASWQLGPTNVGTTQFGDAFMRANFWARHSDAGAGYHVLLGAPTVALLQVIHVPADEGVGYSGSCFRRACRRPLWPVAARPSRSDHNSSGHKAGHAAYPLVFV